MALNSKTRKTTPKNTVVNHEGGISFSIQDPFTKLRIAATSCFFGEPAFYVDGDDSAKKQSYRGISIPTTFGESLLPAAWVGKNTRELMELAIDACLNTDIEKTLQFAVELRSQWYMRATPQVIMVRAAMHPKIKDTGLLAKYSTQIMGRLDEVMTQIAYFESVNGSLSRIPSRLKRAWAARLEKAKEYELAKYKMTGRQVNIFDAVRLCHAKGTPWRSSLPITARDLPWEKIDKETRSAVIGNMNGIDKLMLGEIKLGNEDTETWESIRSSGGSWRDAAREMGHMALLRNLRNLNEANEITPGILANLKNGVKDGKQFPFRYFSAFKAVGTANAQLQDAIEDCFEQSIKFNVPRFAGKGLAIVDVSSSMDTPLSEKSTVLFSEISRLMGIVAAKAHKDGANLLMFGDYAKLFPIRAKSSVFDEMNRLSGNNGCGHGTNIIRAFESVIDSKDVYDIIWVFSDMQCGYVGNVPEMLKKYRKISPNVKVFFVNLAGYQDALTPEFYPNTYLLGGWSDKVLQFAEKMISLDGQKAVK